MDVLSFGLRKGVIVFCFVFIHVLMVQMANGIASDEFSIDPLNSFSEKQLDEYFGMFV